MKLILINPKRVGGYIIQPPLGLGYLASIAQKYCSSVDIWDMGIGKAQYKAKIKKLKEESYDIVGISVFTSDLPEVNRVLRLIKTYKPKTKILVGGPHPTAVKEDIFQHIPLADYAFFGEAEIGFENYLIQETSAEFSPEKITNLIYRDLHGTVKFNNEEFVEDLDMIESPLWELMNPSHYPPAPHGAFFKNYPFAPIIFTRGCPMRCTFCLGANGKPRKRSIENIKEEIRFLTGNLNIRELLVEDENFSSHKELLKEFCHFMIDEYKGQLTWSCPSGLSIVTLNAENIKLMKAAGCHSISVGIEFGTNKMHEATNKRLNLDLIREKLKIIHAIGGINVTGFFLMGLPQEKCEDINNTIDFACSLPLQSAQFNCFMPQPGTEIWRQFNFQDIDYHKYHVHNISYKHPYISKNDLLRLKTKAYLRFYSRPGIIFQNLKNINSLSHLYYLIKRFINSIV
jgi:anaerobic magnesium-protoporphyrin IX monomethyl ester cyclase